MAGQWLSEWLCREEGLQWPASAEEELQGPFEEPCTDNFSSEMCDNTLPDTSISVANNRTLMNSISNAYNGESTNIKVPSNVNSSKVNFKLVLAEPLPDSPWSHVNTFLEAHGGPGLQVSLGKIPHEDVHMTSLKP